MARPVMDKKTEFDTCLQLLRQVAVVRGKDPAKVTEEYVWPVAEASEATTAVSLAPLLTGGGPAQAPASSVVSVPSGLAPPKP